MLNVLIAGVGGQGSVLAARVLAQAAASKGWQVRTAETIGMAQRGGSVASHVRMGNRGETVHAPLVPLGWADCIVALEPGEGVRALPYLAPQGLVVAAQRGVPSVTASLSGREYDASRMLARLRQASAHFRAVDDAAVCQDAGSAKALNIGLLAAAIDESSKQGCGLAGAISIEDLKAALASCVNPRFLDANLAAVDAAASSPSCPG